MRLGAQQVVQVALSVGTHRRLCGALPQYGLSDGQLWAHSVAAALAAQVLATRRPGVVSPEAFTAALMHDVGKLVLARFLDAERVEALRSAGRAGTPLRQAELELLGIEHAEISAAVLEHWKLPERLRVAVRHHHTPSDSDEPLASAVHVADIVGHRAEVAVVGALDREADVTAELDDCVITVGNELVDVLRRYA